MYLTSGNQQDNKTNTVEKVVNSTQWLNLLESTWGAFHYIHDLYACLDSVSMFIFVVSHLVHRTPLRSRQDQCSYLEIHT